MFVIRGEIINLNIDLYHKIFNLNDVFVNFLKYLKI